MWGRRDVKDDLIDAFVWALRLRPQDFSTDAYYLTDNRVPDVNWWIANDDYGFKVYLGGWCHNSRAMEFTSRQRRRAWKAFRHWRCADPKVARIIGRIIDANDQAVEP